MNNFRFITHLETLAVLARLHKMSPAGWAGISARQEFGDGRLPTRSILLRAHDAPTEANWTDDLPCRDSEEFEKWVSLKRLLAQARKAIATDPALRNLVDTAAPPGRVMISGLQKNSTILWHQDTGPYHERHLRFHIPLVTNPACLMYSGQESLHMQSGSLWWFNNAATHSAANFGLGLRLHLIFELRRMGASDDAGEA